jgi:hypothetical protein
VNIETVARAQSPARKTDQIGILLSRDVSHSKRDGALILVSKLVNEQANRQASRPAGLTVVALPIAALVIHGLALSDNYPLLLYHIFDCIAVKST